MAGTMVPPESVALTASELENEFKVLLMMRQILFQQRQDTVHLAITSLSIYVFIMPSGGHVAPHDATENFLHEAVSNIIGWPSATIPSGYVEALWVRHLLRIKHQYPFLRMTGRIKKSEDIARASRIIP